MKQEDETMSVTQRFGNERMEGKELKWKYLFTVVGGWEAYEEMCVG